MIAAFISVAVVVLLIVWLIAGGVSQNDSPSGTPPFDKCAECRRVEAWWASLDGGRKLVGAGWYVLRKIVCAARGC